MNSTPDFDAAFKEAIKAWREQHRIRDDDVILFCVELFHIHQTHWDEVRRRDFPAVKEFTVTVSKLEEIARQIQTSSEALAAQLSNAEKPVQDFMPPTLSLITIVCVLSILCGLLIGRFLF